MLILVSSNLKEVNLEQNISERNILTKQVFLSVILFLSFLVISDPMIKEANLLDDQEKCKSNINLVYVEHVNLETAFGKRNPKNFNQDNHNHMPDECNKDKMILLFKSE